MHRERLGQFERCLFVAGGAAMLLASVSLHAPRVAFFVDVRVLGTECVASFHAKPSVQVRLRCG